MDLSLEPSLAAPDAGARTLGKIAGRPLDEWNAAYSKVENYFHALRIRNNVLRGRLVLLVLQRAMRREARSSPNSKWTMPAAKSSPAATPKCG